VIDKTGGEVPCKRQIKRKTFLGLILEKVREKSHQLGIWEKDTGAEECENWLGKGGRRGEGKGEN